MKTIAPNTEDEDQDSDFKPLTADEARQWREMHPEVSVWRVIAAQALMGVLAALAAWALTGRQSAAWSAGYGALAVVIPAALFARGVMRQKNVSNPGVAMLGFFGWELVKIVLTVAMLVAAPRLIGGLSWLALIAGLILAMKTYWIALVVQSRRSTPD
jgi:ATP synthase protein I